MHNQPNWLQIDEYLFPSTIVTKIIRISSPILAHPAQLTVSLIYNSFNRQIQFVDTLNHIISQCTHLHIPVFNPQLYYQIYIYQKQIQKQVPFSLYPPKEHIALSGQHIQEEIIYIRIEEVDENGNLIQNKGKKGEKTVKEILQKVAEWRKIHNESNKKITLEQAASMVGLCKNTLEDYFIQIKLAEKYKYEFEKNFSEPFKSLRKFVKQNHEKKETKPNPVLNMLQKYQPK